jgi:RNA polymerase sigma-70 factor (ECF subfamily)
MSGNDVYFIATKGELPDPPVCQGAYEKIGNFFLRTAVQLGMAAPGNYNHDDATLVKACRNGDLAAFEVLVHRHQRLLVNIAFRMTGVYEDACDIVQDSFVAAWQKLADFRGEAQFSTWLTAIVINQARNRCQQVRRHRRHEAYSLDAPLAGDGNERLPDPPSGSPSALDDLEEAELRSFLQRCIDALTPEFREVLVLRDMQELAYDEVAAALQLRDGTVKSRLFRARDAVKDCLKKRVASI